MRKDHGVKHNWLHASGANSLVRQKRGCGGIAKNCVAIVRTDLAILFYAFTLKYTAFLTWFLMLKNKVTSLIKITFFERRCDSSLRNVISNPKFCFYKTAAISRRDDRQ